MNIGNFFIGRFRPLRPARIAFRRYWRPRRLTIDDPAIYAWLWWNFSFYDPEDYS